jgi:MFS family permease
VRLVMPRLLKLASEEQLMTYCLLSSGVTYLLFPFFAQPWILAAVAFLLGLGLGCGQPLAMILIYESSPDGRTGEALGLRTSLNKMIQIGVPLVFGSIGSALGLMAVFWSNALLLLSSARLGARGSRPPAKRKEAP